MSILSVVQKSLAAKVAVMLAAVILVLTGVATVIITMQQRQELEQTTLEKARLAAGIGAQQYGDLLETAIDGGALTVTDLFDRNYVLIKGYDWGKNPKYHSRYDSVTDRLVPRLLDKVLADDQDFVFAIGVDDNGYIPTHNSKFAQPVTGNPEKDLIGNRSKRIANYGEGLAAAKNLEPTLLQVYKRNTGETMWDVSSPIFVKGKHWGALRVGVSMERIAAAQRTLAFTLVAIFAVFFVVTVGVMYVVLRRAMQPVVQLTAAAEQISLGEALDTPIKPTTKDEIGMLTKAIDRLRSSMKAAMSRLGH
jgi:HAMP domain-containing protein